MSNSKSPFASIDPEALEQVSGGASRVTARAGGASAELTTMLASIGDSIKGLASKKDDGGGMMQTMMMMMMMGGGGGSSAPAPAPAAAPLPPVINVVSSTRG